jgi:ABC-type branched-subunit amino acid transport system substrate-binding protein
MQGPFANEEDIMHEAARRSLISVMLTAVMITANHVYSLGPRAFALGAVLLVGPAALLWWFRHTKSPVAFVGYLLMNLWIVGGFGLMKGLWGITLPLYLGTGLASLSTAYPNPTLGPYGFEASGILMFIGSLFVAYYAYRLVEAKRSAAVVPGSRARASALVAAMGLVATFVFVDRDRWRAPVGGVVKIGVIVPTTGPYAILGNSFLKAVEMAKADLPETKYQYQLVLVDVGDDPARAKAVIQRVISVERVDAIVGGISVFGAVTRPLATAARIPQTCVCSQTWIGDGAYNFTNIPTPEAEAVLWVREAERRGIRRVALLTRDNPSMQGHVRAVKAEAARVGLAISYEDVFTDSMTDFRPLIARARASNPDVYYVETFSPQLEILGRQLADVQIHNITSVVAPSISAQRELFEGAWYTDSDLRDMAFRARFEEKYPGTQFATHMMPYAYDDFNMLVQAFERGQNPAVYLRTIGTYEGTAGTLTKRRGSGTFESTPAVWVIRDGKPALALNH